jgi:tetratricopeptide (TPR) repeat protein
MRRLFALTFAVLSLPVVAYAATAAPPDKHAKDEGLGKKGEANLDTSLAGDITRKKEAKQEAPALQYDQFRLGVELQVTEKRHEQINDLKKIISLSPADSKEMPSLLYRLGELYWEESRAYFFEANRKDDDLIRALNANDQAAQAKAKAEKADLLGKSNALTKLAVQQYTEIVQKYRDYDRMDEVLYFLGHNLMDNGEDRKALVVYERLITKYPKSRFIPDAYVAFGEYFFNTSKGNHDMLNKALEAYKRAASHPENQVYAFALYKEGWCLYNLSQFDKSMDMFRSVVLYGELAGAQGTEKDGGKSGKSSLIKEARKDYVRSYERIGAPLDARADFSKFVSKPEDLRAMETQLANLYYEDGKDREAAVMYNALIREEPLAPEAPGFQGKIVDCVLRAGNKKQTVQQVRQLVKIIKDVEASGNVKDEKGKQKLSDARELSERTLSNLAVNWHKEAKKTRDDETFALANEVYGDYLSLFPENPKAYDMRFFWAELLNDNLQKYDEAARQYTLVFQADIAHLEKKEKPGRWIANAPYDAVLAYDEVIKLAEQAGTIKTEASDGNKPMKIPAQKQDLLDACLRYLKYLPKGEKTVEITFKAANIYYRSNHFDEAVKMFSDIALNHPTYKFENGDRAGEVSANLVLDSYNLQKDWAKVNEWARKFYANEQLATGDFRAELAKVIEQSSFKLVNALEDKKEYAQAAEAYLAFVKDFPKTQIADKAIFNASVDFFKAHRLDKAIEARNHLVQSYPKSNFVPECIYSNAEAYEAMGQFEHAIDAYEAYLRGFEKANAQAIKEAASKKKKGKKKSIVATAKATDSDQVWEPGKAQIALYDAGVFHEGLGELKAALKDRELYLQLWPDSKDAEKVNLSIIDLYEKLGAYSKVASELEDYERTYERDPKKVLYGENRLYHLFADKLRRPKDAQRIMGRVEKFYEKLPHHVQVSLDGTALELIARQQNLKNEDQYHFFTTLKLKWGRMPKPVNDFKASIKDKKKSLDEVERLYTQTVKLKAADPAICALYKIGLSYENFAKTLEDVPVPRLPGVPEDVRKQLQGVAVEQLTPDVEKTKKTAGDFFASAVAKAHELGVKNECSAASLRLLRDVYRPNDYLPRADQTAPLKLALTARPAVGEGLLTEVQPETKVDLSNTPAPSAPPPPSSVKPASAKSPAPAAKPAPGPNAPEIAPGNREDPNGDLAPGQHPGANQPEQIKNEPAPQPDPQKTAPQGTADEPKDNL